MSRDLVVGRIIEYMEDNLYFEHNVVWGTSDKKRFPVFFLSTKSISRWVVVVLIDGEMVYSREDTIDRDGSILRIELQQTDVSLADICFWYVRVGDQMFLTLLSRCAPGKRVTIKGKCLWAL